MLGFGESSLKFRNFAVLSPTLQILLMASGGTFRAAGGCEHIIKIRKDNGFLPILEEDRKSSILAANLRQSPGKVFLSIFECDFV